MAQSNGKPKVAFYWAASCGGCEITITELGMQLVVVGGLVDNQVGQFVGGGDQPKIHVAG